MATRGDAWRLITTRGGNLTVRQRRTLTPGRESRMVALGRMAEYGESRRRMVAWQRVPCLTGGCRVSRADAASHGRMPHLTGGCRGASCNDSSTCAAHGVEAGAGADGATCNDSSYVLTAWKRERELTALAATTHLTRYAVNSGFLVFFFPDSNFVLCSLFQGEIMHTGLTVRKRELTALAATTLIHVRRSVRHWRRREFKLREYRSCGRGREPTALAVQTTLAGTTTLAGQQRWRGKRRWRDNNAGGNNGAGGDNNAGGEELGGGVIGREPRYVVSGEDGIMLSAAMMTNEASRFVLFGSDFAPRFCRSVRFAVAPSKLCAVVLVCSFLSCSWYVCSCARACMHVAWSWCTRTHAYKHAWLWYVVCLRQSDRRSVRRSVTRSVRRSGDDWPGGIISPAAMMTYDASRGAAQGGDSGGPDAFVGAPSQCCAPLVLLAVCCLRCAACSVLLAVCYFLLHVGWQEEQRKWAIVEALTHFAVLSANAMATGVTTTRMRLQLMKLVDDMRPACKQDFECLNSDSADFPRECADELWVAAVKPNSGLDLVTAVKPIDKKAQSELVSTGRVPAVKQRDGHEECLQLPVGHCVEPYEIGALQAFWPDLA
ncbi:unnamed protein product [Closterium sp. Yama58-4]|nr:unnamed protein product [Closterium sp. Yama58-4]